MNAWTERAPVFERNLLPHELFELFLTNTKMERICVESTNYICLKGNHMFIMTVEKLKVFLTILLVSECAGLLKQEMYWEGREDCHNLIVLAMMTKAEFLECKRFFIWLIITQLIVQINLRKCDHYLMLLTNNAFWIINLPSM